MYDFPWDPFEIHAFPKHLRKYIPNEYASKPTLTGTPDRSALMRTVVLIATRQIAQGEEIFMNYRLNPHFPQPSWYNAVDIEQSRKRWQKPFY